MWRADQIGPRRCALQAALPCVAVRRLRSRRGYEKAALAVGYSILVICYHVLEREVPMRSLAKIASTGNDPAYAKRLVHSESVSVTR